MDFPWKHTSGRLIGSSERFRRKCPINTKRGAEEFERTLRQRLFDSGTLDLSTPDAVPLFKDFFEEFMTTYVVANNKLSEQDSKRSIGRSNLLPAFGLKRLDEIKKHEIESFRASLKNANKAEKRINNVVGVLMKILRYANDIGVLSDVPKIKPLRVPPQRFHF